MIKRLFLLLSILTIKNINAQTPADCAVQLTASVQSSPAQIILSWPSSSTTNQYTVFRKLKSALSWGAATATLSGSANSFTDNSVTTGVSYEYKVTRSGTGYTGYGFINSGINIPATEFRGRLILLVDSFFSNSLSAEIIRLVEDLEGDGWIVSRHDITRTGSIAHVKSVVVNSYNVDPANTKALFLLGHIPVPYSGNLNPDGHSDHLGAWPTDMYYSDIDGIWTDISVTSTTASPARTQNIPGDGKFDQSMKPTLLELQTGRVDLFDLPAFSLNETQLMKNYLDKDHDYRKKIFSPVKRGVVDDNFGYMNGEAFAASGYNAMASVVGTSSITNADYITSMGAGSYQWSFGCGGGWFSGASGVGSTSNFASSSLDGVFTMLFGSYFGDWDITNSFLRAPLAQGKMLTNIWSGRPHYALHHMGLGENIGYSVLTTQNYQVPLYYPNIYNISGGWIHNALMGDPTLRNDIVSPVSNVVANMNGFNCNVSWTASTETGITGYNIYRRGPGSQNYVKLNSSLISGTTYTDLCIPAAGIYKYMVRAEKLETTPSGTFYNLSEGITDTAQNTNPAPLVISQFSATVNGMSVTCVNTSSNSNTFYWDFGNGVSSNSVNPVITYTNGGTYTISLVASGACFSDTSQQIIVISSVRIAENETTDNRIKLFPNPANEKIHVQSLTPVKEISIFTAQGSLIYQSREIPVSVKEWEKGVYFVRIEEENGNTSVIKLMVN